MILFRSLFFACALLAAVPRLHAEKVVLRVGHFPNITHAQALVAAQLQRQGRGWFEARLGPEVKIQWFVYNSGSSAAEGIFAGSLDLTYVGPGPALNAYLRSLGGEMRVVSGAAQGGAALVVRGDGRIASPADFRGKRIATPQLGNTQDVAARVWMRKNGYKVTQFGGDVLLLPTANVEQLTLFIDGRLDGAWTVEPWVSRLELEGKGKIYLEEKEAITTILVASVNILQKQPELVRKFVKAHAELTEWINANPAEAKRLAQAEIKALTKKELPDALMERAWPRLKFGVEVSLEKLEAMVKEAQSVGFLKGKTDLKPLMQIQQ